MFDHPPPRARHRLAAALLATLLALSLVGCTADDAPSAGTPAPQQTREGEILRPVAQARTTATLGKVTGELRRKRRQPLRRSVRLTVDRWLDAAYVDRSYPRERFGAAFPGFSDGAAREALRDQSLMTNAAVAPRLRFVRARKRRVTIDVLARDGRPAGVTAHFVLAQRLQGRVDRVERVTGSLYMTRVKVGSVKTRRGRADRWGWQVFGYDVTRGRLS